MPTAEAPTVKWCLLRTDQLTRGFASVGGCRSVHAVVHHLMAEVLPHVCQNVEGEKYGDLSMGSIRLVSLQLLADHKQNFPSSQF